MKRFFLALAALLLLASTAHADRERLNRFGTLTVDEVVTGSVTLDNNNSYQIKDTAGDARGVVLLDSNNDVYFGVDAGVTDDIFFRTSDDFFFQDDADAVLFAIRQDGQAEFYASGSNVATFDSGGLTMSGTDVQVLAVDSTANRPGFANANDVDTGIGFEVATGRINIINDGVRRFSFDPTTNLSGVDGSVSNPTYSFLSDSGLGIYRSSANTMAFSANGAQRLAINASGPIVNAGDLQFTNAAGVIIQSGQDLDLQAANASNAACNTTCSSTHSAGCMFGIDTGTGNVVACTDASADTCLCGA